jgi:glyoxylase-like metal-dependent hydrolase (beta-lactamase superfamily II)
MPDNVDMSTDFEVVTDLRPGAAVAILPAIHRVVAPNAGMMTGPGTNTYLLGPARDVVLDPGPADSAHVAALLALTDGRIRFILVTHTHRDHSPAASLLASATGARLIGLSPPAAPNHDQSFAPDLQPDDRQHLDLGGVVVQAIHTPGHASNHVCWLHPDTGVLFTGDHVMQGSTVVIPPPDGNMAAYLDSLQQIQRLAPRALAPGHGLLIRDSERAIRRLIRHRLQREARVVDRLRQLGAASLDELLPRVYSDVPQPLHPVARYSLHAHLLKLVAEGRVVASGDRWRLAPGA